MDKVSCDDLRRAVFNDPRYVEWLSHWTERDGWPPDVASGQRLQGTMGEWKQAAWDCWRSTVGSDSLDTLPFTRLD